MDLFNTPTASPLAAVLRPKTLDDIIGQETLTRENSILRRKIRAGQLGSTVLYGPPGIGKTSIARAVGHEMKKEFRALHATRAGVKDIRALADEARQRPLLIFVDEVHRFSATQADDLLAITEEGTADFMGATTQNPFHALPSALVSRSHIFKLEPLSIEDMVKVVERGLDHVNATGFEVVMTSDQIRHVAARSGGDARRALTTLDSLVVGQESDITVSDEMIKEAYQAGALNYDRSGDQHYDITSAFVKSMRGSDPDATLYWLARLIHSGEDPRFIARRIMIHASEDVGLADNSALQTAVAASEAVAKIGYPEAQIILAHAALHVCRAPKSNSAQRGIGLAMEAVKTQELVHVPAHLRDTHYKGAKELGHEGYAFPHADVRGWVEQEYLPGVPSGSFYQSDARGAATFERRADDYWSSVIKAPSKKRF